MSSCPGRTPSLLAIASASKSVIEPIARTLVWARTSRRLRRIPLPDRLQLVSRQLERCVKRRGRVKAEQQIVEFCRLSRYLPETQGSAKPRRYSVSWPSVKARLLRKTIADWGFDVTRLSLDVLDAAGCSNEQRNSGCPVDETSTMTPTEIQMCNGHEDTGVESRLVFQESGEEQRNGFVEEQKHDNHCTKRTQEVFSAFDRASDARLETCCGISDFTQVAYTCHGGDFGVVVKPETYIGAPNAAECKETEVERDEQNSYDDTAGSVSQNSEWCFSPISDAETSSSGAPDIDLSGTQDHVLQADSCDDVLFSPIDSGVNDDDLQMWNETAVSDWFHVDKGNLSDSVEPLTISPQNIKPAIGHTASPTCWFDGTTPKNGCEGNELLHCTLFGDEAVNQTQTKPAKSDSTDADNPVDGELKDVPPNTCDNHSNVENKDAYDDNGDIDESMVAEEITELHARKKECRGFFRSAENISDASTYGGPVGTWKGPRAISSDSNSSSTLSECKLDNDSANTNEQETLEACTKHETAGLRQHRVEKMPVTCMKSEETKVTWKNDNSDTKETHAEHDELKQEGKKDYPTSEQSRNQEPGRDRSPGGRAMGLTVSDSLLLKLTCSFDIRRIKHLSHGPAFADNRYPQKSKIRIETDIVRPAAEHHPVILKARTSDEKLADGKATNGDEEMSETNRTRSSAISQHYLKQRKNHAQRDTSGKQIPSKWNPPVTLSSSSDIDRLGIQRQAHVIVKGPGKPEGRYIPVRKKTRVLESRQRERIGRPRKSFIVFSCPHCDMEDRDRSFMTHHLLLSHADESKASRLVVRRRCYVCALCRYCSETETEVRQHACLQHIRLQPYRCRGCGRRAADVETVVRHTIQRNCQPGEVSEDEEQSCLQRRTVDQLCRLADTKDINAGTAADLSALTDDVFGCLTSEARTVLNLSKTSTEGLDSEPPETNALCWL